MVRLQRQTSFLTAAFIAVALAVSGLASGWYLMSGTLVSVRSRAQSSAPGSSEVAYGATWAEVYLASLVAAMVLLLFAAKGTRRWCLAIVVVAALLGVWLGLVAVDRVGA